MEQLVILLVIGAISLVNWLLQRSAELREKRKLERQGGPAGAPPLPRTGPPPVARGGDPDAEADPAEAMRKLMEALGLPVEEAPPKIPQRGQAPPPLPVPEASVPEPAPPVPARREFPEPVERPARPMAEALAFERELRDFAGKIEMPPLRPAPPKPPKAAAATVAHVKPGRFRRLLSDRSSVRDAVVLSEILGQPKSLR